MPNALFKRFNGTTFEEFKFEAFDSEKLGGVLPSGYALSSHEHSGTDITSGTINIARIPLTNIAGNTNTSFWNPVNGSIAQYSTQAGWFTTTSGLSVTHSARLATTLNTGANTTGVNVFELTNIVPGQYMVMISGRWGRAASLNARAWQGSLRPNNNANISLDVIIEHVSTSSFVAQTMAQISGQVSSVPFSGNFWSTTSSTVIADGSPFFVLGRFSIAGAFNKTLFFDFRQSASDGSNTCSVLAGTSIQLIKVG